MTDIMKYAVRNDGEAKILHVFWQYDDLELGRILEKNYPYIYERVTSSTYHIADDLCMIFKEIIFENKVVGYATYDFRIPSILIMKEIYVLPEFRGNNLFLKEIIWWMSKGVSVIIKQPTKKLVTKLLRYGLAEKLTEYIVISSIPFILDDFDVVGGTGEFLDLDEKILPTHLYDLKIPSTILIVNDFESNNKVAYYHNQLFNDRNAMGKVKKPSDYALKKILNVYLDNEDKISDILNQLNRNLASFGVDNADFRDNLKATNFINDIFFDGCFDDDIVVNYFDYENGRKYESDGSAVSDYDSDIFNVLTFLNEGGDYESVEDLMTLKSDLNRDIFKNMLLAKHYIEMYENTVDWQKEHLRFNLCDLRKIAYDNGLKTSGNKQELINRLSKNNAILNIDFRITEDGKNFLDD